jgi:formylglycine-generating enzyme required for sulfatase activity
MMPVRIMPTRRDLLAFLGSAGVPFLAARPSSAQRAVFTGELAGETLEIEGIRFDVPVYWVSYVDAEAYCQALTGRARKTGALPADWGCRLPTEAQWEYACRANTTTATAFGDRLDRADANFNGAPLDGGSDGPAAGKATRVRSFRANPWGLHDMHGNVFEWCRDWYHAQLPGGVDPDVQVKGVANRDGSYSRVRRGGAWNDAGVFCRSALRLRFEPERISDHIGLRVVLVQR